MSLAVSNLKTENIHLFFKTNTTDEPLFCLILLYSHRLKVLEKVDL